MNSKHFCVAALLLLLDCGCAFGCPQAQEPEQNPAPGQSDQKAPAKKAEATEKRGEIAIAPIPVIDPTIGKGLALTGMYTVRLRKEDTVSPPSTFGAGGFRTDSGSWAFGGGAKLFLKEDRFRILVGAGTGQVNYTFYGIGNAAGENPIPITQSGSGILGGVLVRTFRRWYVGGRYYYFRVSTGLGDTANMPPGPIQDVQFTLPVAALGAHIQRDTRESQFYPTSGSVFDTKLYFSDPSVGAMFQYQDYETAFQQYFQLGKRQVLAYRVKACAVDGHAPFFALCTLGNSADMRGYPAGRYRDRRMLVGQAEFRREIWWRFGASAFMGAGEVAPTFTSFSASDIRPGGGVGLRFTLAPKNHINLRVDYSVGQNSHAWYVGIGEAF